MNKRPEKYSQENKIEAAKELVQFLKLEPDEDLEDIVKTLASTYPFDGYHLAKSLEEKYCWDVDTTLVNDLQLGFAILHKLYKAKVTQWVLDNKLEPTYKVGDLVKVSYRGKEYQGLIKRVDKNMLQYLVGIDELDHNNGKSSTVGVFYNEENINENR